MLIRKVSPLSMREDPDATEYDLNKSGRYVIRDEWMDRKYKFKLSFQEDRQMFDSPVDQKIQEVMKYQSKYISMVIRNAMEDFHTKHLSDAQMKELNPLIRNAVYTALYTIQYFEKSDKAKTFLNYQAEMIPEYWEEPELIGGVGE